MRFFLTNLYYFFSSLSVALVYHEPAPKLVWNKISSTLNREILIPQILSLSFRKISELRWRYDRVKSMFSYIFQVCRDISAGMEVLVWYGDKYLQFMGIPVTLKITTEENQSLAKTDEISKYH